MSEQPPYTQMSAIRREGWIYTQGGAEGGVDRHFEEYSLLHGSSERGSLLPWFSLLSLATPENCLRSLSLLPWIVSSLSLLPCSCECWWAVNMCN